jgi:hypothetical protein
LKLLVDGSNLINGIVDMALADDLSGGKVLTKKLRESVDNKRHPSVRFAGGIVFPIGLHPAAAPASR